MVFNRNSSNKSILLTQFNCDDIKHFDYIEREDIIDSADGEYYFITIKDDKKGLVKCVIKNSQKILFENMAEPIYDDIICKDRNFLLYKEGKIDIIRDESYFNEKYYSKSSNMNGKMYYNNIYSLYGYDRVDIIDNGFYVLCKDGRTYITGIKMSYSLVDIDRVVDIYKNNVIYEKDGKYSIYTSYESGIINSYIGWYDNITHLGAGYFEVNMNGKKGIWYNDKLIISPKYEKIELHGDYMKNYFGYNVSGEIPGYSCKYLNESNKLENSEYVFFVLGSKKLFSDKIKYQLVKTCDNNKLMEVNMNAKRVEFFENVIVVHNNNYMYIYNYKGELATIFLCNTNISYIEYKYKDKDYEDMMYAPIYVIDGQYYLYIYETNTFEMTNVIMDDTFLYMTAYETEYGTVVVNSYTEGEHNSKCRDIERLSLEEADNVILDYVCSNSGLMKKYPKLVRKK